MNILVINVGSSSIKFSLFEFPSHRLISNGLIEENNAKAFEQMYRDINATRCTVDAVGHRVVHGGEDFYEPTILNDDSITKIEQLNHLAPLHNPLNILGIKSAKKIFHDAVHIAIFDTAFHQSLPDYAYRYPLPHELYKKYHIRKYGFHGSSHHYLANESATLLQQPLKSLNLITIHLGNGSSICAVKAGKSVDTTMGMTPLEGLMMGSRCGSIDPSIPLFLMEHVQMTSSEVDTLLNKDSGLKAISGESDMRHISKRAKNGDSNAKLAIAMFVYRIKKAIGSYIAILGQVDAIVFSGGIGENAAFIRKQVCNDLEHLSIIIDSEANITCSNGYFSQPYSKTALLVITANEELHIATQVQKKMNLPI